MKQKSGLIHITGLIQIYNHSSSQRLTIITNWILFKKLFLIHRPNYMVIYKIRNAKAQSKSIAHEVIYKYQNTH